MAHKAAPVLAVAAAGIVVVLCLVPARPALAEPPSSCSRAVIFTLPSVTWADVQRVSPPELLAAIDDGAAGSVSVRTIASRTSYASGFATIGAGTRMEGGHMSGGPIEDQSSLGTFPTPVHVANIVELKSIAEDDATSGVPGALGSALEDVEVVAVGNSDPGREVPQPMGPGRWVLLAAMDRSGTVDFAITGPSLLTPDDAAPFGVRTDAEAFSSALDGALDDPCRLVVVDPGDLIRADAYAQVVRDPLVDARDAALLAADRALGRVRAALDPATDLLLVVAPTSPAWDDDIHLGVAVATGPEFAPGSELRSASTRRAGLVTLPDVAPTVLEHFGLETPSFMAGRPWVSAADSGGATEFVDAAVDLDLESVFTLGLQGEIATIFVVVQVFLYAVAIALIIRSRERSRPAPGWLEAGALAIVAFPIASFLATPLPAHELGTWWFAASLVGIDAALVALAIFATDVPLERLLTITGFTAAVMTVDLFFGGRLQLNAVFGLSPIVAGRFSGLGNNPFTVFATSVLLTGALLVHLRPDARRVRLAAGAIFVAAVIVDGAPWLGSDVGGVISLVPALAVTWLLLSGRRVRAPTVLLGIGIGIVAVAAFLALDLARPESSQTHLARLFEDVRDNGFDVLTDTVHRKVRANARVFTSTIWTYLVPPALIVLGWLLVRPSGTWETVTTRFPKLRAGLIGGLVLAVLGFALNDSGIVIPAMALSFLVPLALLMHLSLERGGWRST